MEIRQITYYQGFCHGCELTFKGDDAETVAALYTDHDCRGLAGSLVTE